ncbi:unnamed protein product, partial [Cylindrotheca closterium]
MSDDSSVERRQEEARMKELLNLAMEEDDSNDNDDVEAMPDIAND